jgi:hypothetical protein
MRNRRSHVAALILAAALLVPAAGLAQSPAQDSAYAVVTKLFDALRARDTSAMRSAFVPIASMHSLRPDCVRFESTDGWISGVARAPTGTVLDERLANPVVHVDGPLASIWVDYWFFVGERFSHCGVDAVSLVRQNSQWRIFSIVDTRRTTGCAPAPPR